MAKLKLRVGGVYVNRAGVVVSIIARSERQDWLSQEFPFHSETDAYREDGTWDLVPGTPKWEDLVTEYDPSPGESPLTNDGEDTNAVLDEVFDERERQESRFGQQNHSAPDWYVILGEEFGEVGRAIYEKDYKNYREELIQVAAVATAMVEAFDRAHPQGYP